MNDWIAVVPGSRPVADVARELLALAADPADVRTARGGNEFLVPPYLANLYVKPPAPPRRRAPKPKEGDE